MSTVFNCTEATGGREMAIVSVVFSLVLHVRVSRAAGTLLLGIPELLEGVISILQSGTFKGGSCAHWLTTKQPKVSVVTN